MLWLASAPKVGLCGCMAVRQPYYIATGGTRQLGKRSRRTSWQGLLLGLLGGAIGRFGVPITPADGALGNSKGESGWDARQARRQPGEQCHPAGLGAPLTSN